MTERDAADRTRRGREPNDLPPGRDRARKAIDSPVAAIPPGPIGQPRRLTAAEREALKQRRDAATARQRARASLRAEPIPTEYPDEAGDPRAASRGIVTLGALLIVGLTVIAFGGSRLFGSAGTDPPPAATSTAAPSAADAGSGGGTPVPGGDGPGPTSASTTPPAAADRPVVCIDPGHGGPDDLGRVAPEGSPYYPATEAMLVLEHAWDLEAQLEQLGIDAVLTRNDNVPVNAAGLDVNGDGRTIRDDTRERSYGVLDELQARINICNEAGADLLISLHVNGFDRPQSRGYETWYTQERAFGDQSYRFATLVYRNLKEELAAIGYVLPEAEERGVKRDTAIDDQRERASFRHLVMTGPAVEGKIEASQMPGALVEALFLTNDGDAAVLTSPAGRNAVVTAYKRAIVAYFEEFPPQ